MYREIFSMYWLRWAIHTGFRHYQTFYPGLKSRATIGRPCRDWVHRHIGHRE